MISTEVQGVEWDWFARDQDGHVALISSGGSGQVPRGLLAHEQAIAALLGHLGIRCDAESWRMAAAAGLFGYDVDLNGGPFRRVATPKRPTTLDAIPEPHRSLIALATVDGRFANLRRLDFARVSCAG